SLRTPSLFELLLLTSLGLARNREPCDSTRMAVTEADNPLLGEITCGTLLQKLQEIWDEVGESDEERDKLLLQIEEECLNVYKKKVELAAKSRAELLQTLSDANVELSNLIAALGDKSYIGIPDKTSGTIKEQLSAIAPALEQLWQQKEERLREFSGVQSQIQKICEEIAGGLSNGPLVVDESDLSLKRLDDYKSKLQELQKEKSDRLNKVLEFVSTVHDLCAVLGLDFLTTVTEVHPSLDEANGVQNKSISNETLSTLANTVLTLKEDKNQRLKKLQELATQLTDLWNLMDTPNEERELFDHVTCHISASVHEVTVSGALALDLIEQAEVEVDRLDKLKASRMKEIAFRKQTELEEIYARAHIEIKPEVVRERIMSLVDSGNTEPAELLAQMDGEIAKAKEEAFSRKEILDRVEKWMSACEEESWLEDYNLDQNRYSASRGAHLNLKRAEKARILVSKITAMVDTLVAKTRAWEEDKSMSFEYDGVPLLAMLDEYTILRQEREEEKRRQKEQKKQQEQPHTDQDTSAFGSKPSPARPASAKKPVGTRANGGGSNETPIKRLSMNGNKSKRDSLNKLTSPSNLGAVSKEDAASPVLRSSPRETMSNTNEPAKTLLPYLQRADELQKHEPLVAYYCRLYAMEKGLKIPQSERTKTTNSILMSLINQLEKDKKSLTLSPDDNMHVEGFALNVFAKADKQDRAGRADLGTAKTFYAANIFFEILSQFGPVPPDIEQKQKYAAWKAADIRKAIKEGRKPTPGDPVDDESDLSLPSSGPSGSYDLGASDTNVPSQHRTEPGPSHDSNDDSGHHHFPEVPQHHLPPPRFHDNSNNNYQTDVPPPPPSSYPSNDLLPPPTGPSDSPYPHPYNHQSYHQDPPQHMPPPPQNYPSHEPSPNSLPNFQSYPSFSESSLPATPSHFPSHYQNPEPYYSSPHSAPAPSSSSFASAPPPSPYSSSNGRVNVPPALDPPAQKYHYDSSYQPGPEKIAEAHKAARFAVGALAFDEISTAVEHLKKSLELLTNPSAGH
ncbi:hypothetical protein HID58_001635, partial [Brassica napus]